MGLVKDWGAWCHRSFRYYHRLNPHLPVPVAAEEVVDWSILPGDRQREEEEEEAVLSVMSQHCCYYSLHCLRFHYLHSEFIRKREDRAHWIIILIACFLAGAWWIVVYLPSGGFNVLTTSVRYHSNKLVYFGTVYDNWQLSNMYIQTIILHWWDFSLQ